MDLTEKHKKESDEMIRRLKKAMKDCENGDISKSELGKISKEEGKRLKEMVNERKKYNDKRK